MKEQIIELLKEEARWSGPFLLPVAISLHHSEGPDLETISAAVNACRACRLALTRTNVVFGEGDPHAALMFVGEGPGAVEDATGRPFVGPAGELLTRMIAAMGLERPRVYIANVVKCRPPGNRDPEPDEIEACIGYLRAQIRAVRPRVIIALGRVASHALLGVSTPLGRLRGNFFTYEGISVMPTYHPSYLLQNPERKRDTWQDVQKVMEVLGLKPQPVSSGR